MKFPKISDAEREVMEVLWKKSPLSAGEIINQLAEHKQWSHLTIRTLLIRLRQKGAVKVEGQNKRYQYLPTVNRSQCVRKESETFLEKAFQGKAFPMLMHFVQNTHLKPGEIKELKRILEEKD